MLVALNPQELERCAAFSRTCAENQQEIEFGQSDTVPRKVREIARDNLIGKIAEVAFAKMLSERHNLEAALDFEYYPRGKWDGQDTVINGWKIDVKGTRQGGQWMLIEWSKLNFRQKDNDLPHLFVMASVKWDRKNDRPTGEVDLVGSASIFKLRPGQKNTLILKKGDCIPGARTPTPLQADNYGIHFDNLEHDWDFVVRYLLAHEPPDVGGCPCPKQIFG